MSKKKKNNIIIGSLCAVVLLMAVGYAAFATQLNITGTGKITSNWNILITDIQTKNIVGGASNASDPTGKGTLTATFNTNLVSPGDSIEYDITVSNQGTLNAVLEKITLTDSNNPAIKFTTTGLTEGDPLNAGDSKVLTVKVEYDNAVTSQPENTEGTFKVTLDYSQKEGTLVTPNESITPDDLKNEHCNQTSGDGLYADTYESGRCVYKGTNPDNYITFNDETWRILSVENDGTLKITKKDSIGNKKFDSQGKRDSGSNGAGGTYCAQNQFGCNAWMKNNNFVNGNFTGTVLKDSEVNTYLNNDYYTNLSDIARKLITPHNFAVGPVKTNNTDLNEQIASENSIIWNGEIGLMSVSDFIRANTNVEQCGNHALVRANSAICKPTNYLVPETGLIWSITPAMLDTDDVFYLASSGGIGSNNANYDGAALVPTVYISSNIKLSGEGTSNNPYTIN